MRSKESLESFPYFIIFLRLISVSLPYCDKKERTDRIHIWTTQLRNQDLNIHRLTQKRGILSFKSNAF